MKAHIFVLGNAPISRDSSAESDAPGAVARAPRRSAIRLFSLLIAGLMFQTERVAGADCANAPADMVAWWRADGDAGDAVGIHHGNVVGAMFVAGRVGQAFSFNGVNGISITDAAALRPTTNMTIEGWIKTPGISESALAEFIVARSGNDGFSGYDFAVGRPSQNGRLRFTLNGGIGGGDVFSTNSVTDDLFHHVAATYDGTTIRLYRDGLLDQESAFNQPISYAAGDPLWIGRRQFTTIPGHFVGQIDELSIYNRALSASEIAAIHAAGSAGKCDRPVLNIAALPGAVRLTWKTNSTGFLLETNRSLTHSAGWGVVTSNYAVLNANYAVTNTLSGGTLFYRLVKP